MIEDSTKLQSDFRLETRETFAEMKGHWRGTQNTLKFIAALITIVGVIVSIILGIAFTRSPHALFSLHVTDTVVAQQSGIRPR